MDLLKTPSTQSLLDSDLDSVHSLQFLDIEELDDSEYALPPSTNLTLEEVLNTVDDENFDNFGQHSKNVEAPVDCSALQVDILQAISQQLIQAQERSSAGATTAISFSEGGQVTAGTANGHILNFQQQVLRWVCDSNADRGAVSCLSYSKDSTRLLAGFARGLVCQYSTSNGVVLRRVVLGGELWGILKVAWGGTTGLALDSGGSVWLIKFSRLLGVRSARPSCLFSGARGEVVAMEALDSNILALATLTRIIVVAGARAAGTRFAGPPDTLPVLMWSENDCHILICARAMTMQWLSVVVNGSNIIMKPLRRVQLSSHPMWLGWLDNSIAILNENEELSLWGNDYDKPLDLSDIEPVYASAFFKGLWTDGRVSRAMCLAGTNALAGVCSLDGMILLLGRRGIVKVQKRDAVTRARSLMEAANYIEALKLMLTSGNPQMITLVKDYIQHSVERPYILSDKTVSNFTIKLCLKYKLSEHIWGQLWDLCSQETIFLEALADSVLRGEMMETPPTPDVTQALIEKLADFAPELIERIVVSLPLTSLDPHNASTLTRSRGLWRAVGAIAATLSGTSAAIRELCRFVRDDCPVGVGVCTCAGDALLLSAADGLGGRGAAGCPLPDHMRPSARHDALQVLLQPIESEGECKETPLQILLRHDARALVRLLEQSGNDPPFVGPLGKQNRLRVARVLVQFTPLLQESGRIEIVEFVTGQLKSGALPADQELIRQLIEIIISTNGERSDSAWCALFDRPQTRGDLSAHLVRAEGRPRVLWRLYCLLGQHNDALQQFHKINSPSSQDVTNFFEYIKSTLTDESSKIHVKQFLVSISELDPRTAAGIIVESFPESLLNVLKSVNKETSIKITEYLHKVGKLDGDVAIVHLRNLCTQKPDEVVKFLVENSGLVKPEQALAIVQDLGPKSAQPLCLEKAGDPESALNILIELHQSERDVDMKPSLIREACELCARVSPTVPITTAEAMWSKLIQNAKDIPPSLLLDAISYLPIESLIGHTCHSVEIALTILGCASEQLTLWRCASRVLDRELHESLALSLHVGSRGRSVRCTRCIKCRGALFNSMSSVRACVCGAASHASCTELLNCSVCTRTPQGVYNIPHVQTHSSSYPPFEHNLSLMAPPWPDLEGLV